MKKTMKKCLTLLLALAMLLAMAVPAVAEENYSREITFTKVAQGDTVKAYKLVGYNATYTGYEFHEDFKTFVGQYNNISEPFSAEDYLKDLDSTHMAALLAGYVNMCQTPGAIGGHALPTESATATADASNQVTLTLEPGYYVVLGSTTATNDRTYQLTSVFVQVKNDNVKLLAGGEDITAAPTMELKHTTGPIISMSVKDNSGTAAEWKGAAAGQVGEVLDFYIHLELPAYNNGNVYMTKLSLTDAMHGLEYVDGSAKLTTTAPHGEAGAVEKAKGLTSTPGNYDADGNQTVTFKVDYHEFTTSGDAVSAYIYFQAKVMPEAVAGKTATADTTLTYTFSLEPNTFRTTSAVGVKVHTYAFSLAKLSDEADGATGFKPLTNAGFTLYSDAGMTTVNAVSMIKETVGGETYYRPATAAEIAVGTGIVTEMAADLGADYNTLLVRGLDAATYYLKETKVPSGYYAPKGGFAVQLTGEREAVSKTLTGKLVASSSFTATNTTDNVLLGTASVNGTEQNRLDASLKNSSTPVLPTTGGVGTVMFTVIGLLCMGAALWFFLFARRRREDEQEQNKTTL